MAKVCELTGKTYEQIQVVPAVAKVAGNVEMYQKTLGFYLVDSLKTSAGVFIEGQKATLLIGTESVKVIKVAGSEWFAGDPVFYLDAGAFTNVDDGSGKLAGKVAEGAALAATEGFIILKDFYPNHRGRHIGTALVPYIIGGSDQVFSIYTTSPAVAAAGNVEPLILHTILTGIGATGGRALFKMSTQVALGGWANALKAIVEFGATGRVTGLASAFCAEMVLPTTAPPGGNYAPLEVELVAPTGAGVGAGTKFMHLEVSGAGAAAFQNDGYFFDIQGLGNGGTGKLFYPNTTNVTLRCRIGATEYFLGLTKVEAAS